MADTTGANSTANSFAKQYDDAAHETNNDEKTEKEKKIPPGQRQRPRQKRQTTLKARKSLHDVEKFLDNKFRIYRSVFFKWE